MRKIKDLLLLRFLQLVLMWTLFAISFQVTMLALSFVKPKLTTKIGNELAWKLDGQFKN